MPATVVLGTAAAGAHDGRQPAPAFRRHRWRCGPGWCRPGQPAHPAWQIRPPTAAVFGRPLSQHAQCCSPDAAALDRPPIGGRARPRRPVLSWLDRICQVLGRLRGRRCLSATA